MASSNINGNQFIVKRDQRPSSDVTFPAGYFMVTYTPEVISGYHPVGIVGWSVDNRTTMYITIVKINSNGDAAIGGINSATEFQARPLFDILYAKN